MSYFILMLHQGLRRSELLALSADVIKNGFAHRLQQDRFWMTVQYNEYKGAADGKTISTEAALKYVLERKATYDGPDREQYVAELDQFVDEFRKKHGPQIPVAEAYAILKELEARFGRVK
ncbi:MAG TPA: hypothetical protein VHT24_14475 [Pseudacidobacterium sp.]|jgi:hypothetical protein|nr:hypothetical protein [Pseudacidobacterium sp.]